MNINLNGMSSSSGASTHVRAVGVLEGQSLATYYKTGNILRDRHLNKVTRPGPYVT